MRQVAEERRKWERFGLASRETTADSVTVQTGEDIPFERIRQLKSTQVGSMTGMVLVLVAFVLAVLGGRVHSSVLPDPLTR